MEYMLMPLRRYADFSGRSRRMEYWMFMLFQVIVMVVLFGILGVAGAFESGGDGTAAFGLIVLYLAVFFIPSLAVQVRRFHDQDKSGWFVLLGFIPYLGGLIVFIFMCLNGTPGPNRFGEDPKDPTSAAVFE